MCGIAGFAGSGCQTRISGPSDTLNRMADSLRHRGPDDAGIWLEEPMVAGLAHRRLAIVDLSRNGHQPMRSADGRFVLVYNGEIYNHLKLRTELEATVLGRKSASSLEWCGTSDTETLVEGIAHWGVEATVRKCVGMFAFAVWDRLRRTLSLVRDRVGEKPLYYSVSGDFLAFASEPKALLEIPGITRRLDHESLPEYLAFGYVPGIRSMFAGINKMPPAGLLEFDVERQTWTSRTYWQLPPVGDRRSVSPRLAGELADQLEQLLAESVRGQLQADVPVAVLLSGGIDSSLVAAFAARATGRIRTFTIGFPGASAHDERPHARLIARHFGTDHLEIPLERANLDTITHLSKSLDEPMCDSSIIPTYLVSKAVRQHVTVVLGGDGGDELFAGYRAYNLALMQAAIRATVPTGVRRLVANCGRRMPPGVKGRSYLAALDGTARESAARALLLFDRSARAEMLAGGVPPDVSIPELLKEASVPDGLSILQMATRMDFHNYLPEDLLNKVDRASMQCSLEVRAPFLDHRVVEFAFGQVPDGLKAGWRDRKILPRVLAKRIFPAGFNLRRKQGFSIPLKSWLGTKGDTTIHDAARCLPADLVKPAYIDNLFASQKRGFDNSERIFCLALLSLWLKEYRVSY